VTERDHCRVARECQELLGAAELVGVVHQSGKHDEVVGDTPGHDVSEIDGDVTALDSRVALGVSPRCACAVTPSEYFDKLAQPLRKRRGVGILGLPDRHKRELADQVVVMLSSAQEKRDRQAQQLHGADVARGIIVMRVTTEDWPAAGRHREIPEATDRAGVATCI